MELVLEILNSRQFVSTEICRKTFSQAGGVIGRGADCDWIIPDPKRHMSSHHARISYHEGAFHLTDISSNGIQNGRNGAWLRKEVAVRVDDRSVYVMGDFEIHARLIHNLAVFDAVAAPAQDAAKIIPDDAFLNLDPPKNFSRSGYASPDIEQLGSSSSVIHDGPQYADYARIDTESLIVPQLVDAPVVVTPVTPEVDTHPADCFWEDFGSALGVDLDNLDQEAKKALALSAARLLRQSIGGLQQSLRTRSELKNELRLGQTLVEGAHKNPLKFAVDAGEALNILLQPSKPGQVSATHAVARAFRDLQAHQVALLAASRATVRSTVEHFSPQQLTLRFERDYKPLLATSGSLWRAYGRYHQTLLENDDWTERVLARDFAQAYEQQIRLISALNADLQG